MIGCIKYGEENKQDVMIGENCVCVCWGQGVSTEIESPGPLLPSEPRLQGGWCQLSDEGAARHREQRWGRTECPRLWKEYMPR